MIDNDELKILDQHCAQLGEHFDSVQIFVTRFDSEIGTESLNYGTGNWFARRGQVQDWLIKKTEETCLNVRNEEDRAQ